VNKKDDPVPANGGTSAYSTTSEDGNVEEDSKKEDPVEQSPEKEGKEENAQDVNMSEVEIEGEIIEKKVETPKSAPKDESPSGEDTVSPKPEHSQYSTRGRNSSRETEEEVISDRLEGIKSRFDDDVGIERERTHTSSTVSFLDNISEEQRRTRMRFVPAVDGMSTLSKSEIKHDLQLARAIVSGGHSSGLSSRRARPKRKDDDDDEEMVDEEDGTGQSDDERMNDHAISSDNSGSDHFRLSSKAFVAPPSEQLHRQIYANGASDDGDGSSKVFSYASSSPHIVESTTAFDPPRPPESVGPKKKHRMMRWESRPEDVEMDLDSYRKTVQRTRKELKNAQTERHRIEAVSGHLRSHFLSQLSALNDEGQLLNEELEKIQLDCVKAADLLQSRTRSRGVGKGSYVMKDVLNILKSKGIEISEKDEAGKGAKTAKDKVMTGAETTSSGIGGVDAKGLIDWSQNREVQLAPLANAYILVGNKVNTPYGEGLVKHVYGPTILDVNAESPESNSAENNFSTKTVQHGFGAPDSVASSNRNEAKEESNADEKDSNNDVAEESHKGSETGTVKNIKVKAEEEKATQITNIGQLLPPRVCVQLPFGTGYFPISELTSQECVSSYSDSMLVSRWKGMVDQSMTMAGTIDFAAMANVPESLMLDKRRTSMRRDDNENEDMNTSDNNCDTEELNRFIPYGSAIMPTSSGRGAKLYDIPITSLEREMDRTLFASEGILGKKNNRGVPKKFREWEDIRDEISVLHAQVLQRRNEIARQRRIRLMNEKSLSTACDKSNRVENLVIEMRTDLKSLKDRLDYELIELGIDGETTDRLLAEHYEEEDYEDDFASVNPPKRKVRHANESTSNYNQNSSDDYLQDSRQSKRARYGQ